MLGTRVGAVAALLTVPLAGCGAPAATPAADGPISYAPVGTTMTIECGAGRSLTIAGSNNRLTVTGRCTDVEITGNDNRVTVDAVSTAIRAGGVNNTVTYRDGNPTVQVSGAGNTVTRG